MLLYVNPLEAYGNAHLATADLQDVKRDVAAKELEHLFAYMLLQEMRKTVPRGGLFDSGQSQRIQEEMFDDALAKAIAESGQLGIAELVTQQLEQTNATQAAEKAQPLKDGPLPADDQHMGSGRAEPFPRLLNPKETL